MKLVIAIVHSDDSHNLNDELTTNGFSATKLATTGGFLRSGNTTFFVGVEEEDVQKVIDIIKRICQTRKQISMTTSPVGGVMPYPIEVEVGGAVVFVQNVERFEKL